jgi:NAD(P)-dependent dehydrogenase (short-subunit alcohol dehydrogenase family)
MSRLLLVTGGGRGIGAAIARAAARDGWAVAVNYVASAEHAEATAAAIRAEGGTAHALRADVSDPDQVALLFAQIDTLGAPLRGLVNNAGGSADFRIAEMTPEQYDRIMNGNVRSAAFCARHAIPRMAAAGGGTIVNMSSRAAVLGGQPGRVIYAAAKAALDGFTVGLANEVGKQNIRVVGVRPGVIATDSQVARAGAERLAAMTATIAAGRPGTPEDVADVVAFLLSDGARYITGSTVDIAGGR